MGNQVVFPENNPLPRNLFCCGQAKQAASLYHSNFRNRIDKMGIVLNYGEMPLLQSKYLSYIQDNKHPHGENVIVAIMSYTGYNVEDSILFNRGSVERGLFRTTYYNMYETYENIETVNGKEAKTIITNVFDSNVNRIKPGYDFDKLDDSGMVKPNTKMHDKIALIGRVTEVNDTQTDASIFPKKGQLGYVDKTYVTSNDVGHRICKVRLREERIPAIGDKICIFVSSSFKHMKSIICCSVCDLISP